MSLEDGRPLEIDNNRIENAIRPFVLGRKNWLFSATVAGVEQASDARMGVTWAIVGVYPGAVRRDLALDGAGVLDHHRYAL